MRILVTAWVIAGLAGTAAADGQVVVKPFAGEDDLAIYGKPVADEVASALQKAGVKCEVIVGEINRGDVVVELSAVKQKKLVRLEAAVKPVEGGADLAKASAKPVKVAQLAQAASQLAKALAPKLPSAIDKAKAARPDPNPPTPASAPAPDPTPAPTPTPTPTPPPPAGTPRPTLVLAAPDGQVSGVGLRSLGIAPLRGVAERAGYRVVEAKDAGMMPPEVAAQAARQHGAKATVMVQLISANIAKKGVLYGRGRVQVVAIGDDGWVLFNRVVDTDTVVGSKTDGHDTLVGFMVRQAMEIVGRDLIRAVKR
jgi:hypothetical protein